MRTDPLIHLGPLRMVSHLKVFSTSSWAIYIIFSHFLQKAVGVVMLIMDKFGSSKVLASKRKKDIYIFLIFSLAFSILFFLISSRA